MKKIVFFPFHHDIETLLKDREHLIDTEITGIISYNEDAPFVEKLCSTYGITNRSYDELLNECNTVLILDNYRKYSQNKYYSVIDDANRLGKDVLITPLVVSQLDLSGYEGKFSLLKKEPCNILEIDQRYNMEIHNKLYDLEIPAVGVMGQGINCGKFECQKLVNNVLSTECKTVVLSTNALGALYGFYTMPDFMYVSLSFNEKVLKFKKKYGLEGKFVVMYSGNIGLYYDLENLIKVIEKYGRGTKTPDGREVVFAFVGAGSVLDKLVLYVKENHMDNVVFIPYQEKSNLIYSLNAGDVHWCVNAKGIKGVSCPSKAYGIMAAGKPILGVLELGSEVRCLIEDTGCGLCCEPGEYDKVEDNIRWFIDNANSKEISDMGIRGRETLEKNLTRNISVGKYVEEILKM